jgi:hypothetical protein
MALQYCLWGFGLILSATGIGYLYGVVTFLRRSVKTKGRFVSWETAQAWTVGGPGAPPGQSSYRATVAFTAPDGSERRVKGTLWVSAYRKPKTRKGSAYPVRYNPANPDDARIATLGELWLGPFGFLAVGSFLLFLAVHNPH